MAAAEIGVRLSIADGDAEEVDRATGQLRAELLGLDVEDVRVPSGGPAPEGSRSVEAAQVGALLVTVLSTPGVLATTVATVREWLGRRSSGKVELTLDGDTLVLDDATPEQQDALVRAWLARHG